MLSPSDDSQVRRTAETQLHTHLRDGRSFGVAVETVADQCDLKPEELRDLAYGIAVTIAADEGIAWLEEGDSPALAEEQGLEKLRNLLPADIDPERKEELRQEVIEEIEAGT